ncbi:hypothetical protein VPHD518_0083 [Vibrio phage D518]
MMEQLTRLPVGSSPVCPSSPVCDGVALLLQVVRLHGVHHGLKNNTIHSRHVMN